MGRRNTEIKTVFCHQRHDDDHHNHQVYVSTFPIINKFTYGLNVQGLLQNKAIPPTPRHHQRTTTSLFSSSSLAPEAHKFCNAKYLLPGWKNKRQQGECCEHDGKKERNAPN